MSIKALRRPHEFERTATQFIPVTGPHRTSVGARVAPGAARLTARWTVGNEGRLELAWAFEAERPSPTHILITRKRGSND